VKSISHRGSQPVVLGQFCAAIVTVC